jgi:T5SS/PEP-CTERM-associated repeat protein
MSLPFNGFKAAQTGLVDMGNISFYNTYYTTTPPTLPVFNPFELAQYATSFSEIVLNVTWAQLQTAQGSLDTSFIDNAIQQVNQFNSTYHTDLGIKLRVWGGFTAPDWVKEINGAPITVTGQNAVDPGSYAPQTIGRFWTADYINAWQTLQNALATKYDGMAIIRGISQTAGAYATDEPFVPLKTNAAVSPNTAGTVNQIAQLQMGGFNDAGEMLTLRAAIADYSQWSTTPLDYTMNTFHLFDSGVELNGGNFTLAVLQQARNSARIVQAGNHALRDPLYSPDDVVYGQLANDAMVKPGSVSNSFQTAAPIILAGYPGWQAAVGQGVLLNAGNIELWDFPTNAGVPNGFLSFSAAELQGLASILAAGSPPPTTGAPDDGSLLGLIAPAAVTGAPGRVAFSGTDAVLLASNSAATSYTITLTSLNGGTLGISGLDGFFGATSGTTLNFNGSLSLVNTVLAHLTDTVSSGTDVVHVVATDNTGNTIVRDVGVQTAAPVAPPAVTPGLLPANQLFSFTDGAARVVGQGQATNLDVAAQLGNSGILVVGGVQSQLALAGNLDLSGSTSLLAALSPNAYSTASLTIGGAFSVQSGSSTYFSGTLAANTINNAGGTIRGNGTLDATGSASITNTGTIEAVADFTLGSQRLVVSDNLTGAGTLTIDAGATLVLNGTVNTQTVNFVANSATQLAQYPYSPSTLVLKDPGGFTASTINGFTFADRLVLENVTLAGTPTYAGGVLTVNQASGPPLTFALPDPDGNLTGLNVQAATSGTSVVINFVAPTGGIAPGVFVPATLHGTAGGVRVLVPDIVLKTPLADGVSAGSETYSVTVQTTGTGFVRIEGFDTVAVGGGTSVTIPNVATTTSTARATTLAQIEQYLQTLTYEARGTAGDTITITVTDSAARSSGAVPISVTNTAVSGAFEWQPAPGSTDFTDPANWTVGTTAPGGGNFALFNTGDHTATGNGAVGQLINFGTTTLTGNIVAQGIGDLSAVVDNGGALTLTGGALLSAQQQAIVGRNGQGLLIVAGGALALGEPVSQASLIIGQRAGSTGTVLNLEQISALGTVVVGGAGTGTLELLGVASSMSDGGGEIGQSAGAQGSVIVNGGEWTNNGLLTVGDAGTGSLLINGMNRGITGQVTAWNATIGNQATGQGTVTLDGGELLVANIFSASSTLVVGNLGSGSLVLQNGSEAAVGAAQGQLANNTGTLIVGAAGSGLVRIGAYSSLLVYGDAAVGGSSGTGQMIVGQGTDDGALFATNGALAVGAHGQVTLGGTQATLRAANIDVAAGGSISGAGTVSGMGGGNNTVALTDIDNNGAITAEGGNLLLYGSVEGTGTLGVGNNATLTLQGAVESSQTLTFGNNSKAVLNDVRAFHGTITGFGPDDVLDIAGVQATNPSWGGGVLTLDTPFGQIFLNITGPYSRTSFSVQSDGLGGTYVSGGYGDVHIVSLDGFAYDFQAVGEFVAARGNGGGTSWQVQIQTDGQHGTASWTIGLAAQFGDTAVIFEVGKPITLHVDGAADTVLAPNANHAFSGGTLTAVSADTWRVAWTSGEVITVSEHGISLDWQVSAHDPNSVQGLLGPNSAPWSYLWLPDGTMMRHAWSNDQIVGAYADGWRVADSLFEHHHSPL